MPKNTKLGEDAAIYQQKNSKQSEREKLKDMPWSKKISYLWDYYRYHALITILLAASIAYTIYSVTKPKVEVELFAVIINNTVEPQTWDEYKDKVAEHLKLDPEREDVMLNYSFYYNGAADYEANMRQAFAVYLASSEIDVVIAPLSEFSDYVENGFFAPLSDQLPTDLYSYLTDRFYLSGTADNPKVSAYGIYLEDTKLYREHSLPTDEDPVLIGIVSNSLHKANTVEFIRYLFNEK